MHVCLRKITLKYSQSVKHYCLILHHSQQFEDSTQTVNSSSTTLFVCLCFFLNISCKHLSIYYMIPVSWFSLYFMCADFIHFLHLKIHKLTKHSISVHQTFFNENLKNKQTNKNPDRIFSDFLSWSIRAMQLLFFRLLLFIFLITFT